MKAYAAEVLRLICSKRRFRVCWIENTMGRPRYIRWSMGWIELDPSVVEGAEESVFQLNRTISDFGGVEFKPNFLTFCFKDSKNLVIRWRVRLMFRSRKGLKKTKSVKVGRSCASSTRSEVWQILYGPLSCLL